MDEIVMAKKFKVQQYFDTYPDGEWLFDTEEEAIEFYENKCRQVAERYKVEVYYKGEVEV
ncbi:TPA: hypothetical protein U2D46_001940 [Streptococcus suis]|uniref:hypothetical protein n=1 Tax=Streptococcus suis TaxID=1307 RepID=UPI0015C571F2|nr:hypothetical protein [Streptococcus suis]MCK3890745.1 hypothetical protein [Streptococcus suis]NQM01862.1 hypothetical protein [Streptococcus suis]QZT28512.1 hypothetical protein K6969_07260 [Streptococcus suis]HEM4286166.1 hypothetical protein [Streptococcus suis]HEM6182732.1 hypothetical protein [Streptococcus suis]